MKTHFQCFRNAFLSTIEIKRSLARIFTIMLTLVGVVKMEAQIKPVPQSLPYFQDFGTNAAVWVDPASPNSAALTASGFVLTRMTSGARSTDLAQAESRVLNDVDFSGVVRNFVSQGTNARFQPVTSVLGVGTNAGFALSSGTQTTGFVMALNTIGYKDIVLSYTLISYETVTGTSMNVALQYANSTDIYNGTYTTEPSTVYSNAGKPKGTVDIFTVTLPSSFNNKSENYVRLLLWYPSGFPSVVIDDISVTGTAINQPTNPVAQPLNYIQNFGTSDIFPYPAGVRGFESNVISNFPIVLSDATREEFFNRNTQNEFDSVSIVSAATRSTADMHALTSTTAGGSKLLMSLGSRVLGLLSSVNTVGKNTIRVSYDVQFTEDGKGTPLDTFLTLALEYRIGTTGGFNLVPGGVFTTVGLSRGHNELVRNLALPVAAEDKPIVQLRWLAFANYPIPATSSWSLSLDNISVTGIGAPLPASQIAVLSGFPTGNVIINNPFTIVAETRNASAQVTTVSGATQVQLVATGASITGTTLFTIPAGSSGITFSGINFVTTGAGVTLSIQSVSGNALASATSGAFTVLGALPPPVETYAQPTTRSLPIGINFGSDPSVWNDPTDPSETIKPLGLVVARRAGVQFQTFNDANLSDYLTTGFVGGASVNPVTYPGNNVGLSIESRNNRGEALVLAANTFGYQNIVLTYQLIPTELPVGGVYNMVAQARVGNSGFYTTLTGTMYVSTGPGVTLNTPITFTTTLPGSLSNQPLINIRWIRWHNSVANSVAINNISVTGTLIPPTKLVIGSITPSQIFTDAPFNVQVKAQNAANLDSPVSQATTVSLTGIGAVLGGTVTATIPAGQSSVTVSGVTIATTSTGVTVTASVTAGDALTASVPSAPFNVAQSSIATKLRIKAVVAATGSIIYPNQNFTVVVEALNDNNQPALVSAATLVSLTATGRGTLGGNVTGTIPASQSEVSITGVTYSTFNRATTVTASASGLATSPASNAFNVGTFATQFEITSVLPQGSYTVRRPIEIRVKFLDDNGKGSIPADATTFTLMLEEGTCATGISNVTKAIEAYSDSVAAITGIEAYVPEVIRIKVTSAEYGTQTTAALDVKPNALAGLQILYREDFEGTVKVPGQPNPAFPAGMSLFNVDGKAGIPTFYNDYGTNAFVLRRIRQRGYVGIAAVGDDDGKTYFFNNANSANPDSNFVAFATSYFSDVASENPDANRWLVTPAISLSGDNLKLQFQAMSFTSSGNFKDDFQVLFSTDAPGSSININNWEAFDVFSPELPSVAPKKIITAPTRPTTYVVTLPSTFNNQTVYFAIRLVTKSPGGDRLAIDNILVTSGTEVAQTFTCPATSVEETAINAPFTVYPNPTEGLVYVNAAGEAKVLDITGNVVLSSTLLNGTLDVSGLNAGVYFLKVGSKTAKIVKY